MVDERKDISAFRPSTHARGIVLFIFTPIPKGRRKTGASKAALAKT
jgi:hypothetical protein